MTRAARLLVVSLLLALILPLASAKAQPGEPPPTGPRIMHLESALTVGATFGTRPNTLGYGAGAHMTFLFAEHWLASFAYRVNLGNYVFPGDRGSGFWRIGIQLAAPIGYRVQFGSFAQPRLALDMLVSPSLLFEDRSIYRDTSYDPMDPSLGLGAWLRFSSHAGDTSFGRGMPPSARRGYFFQLGAELYPARLDDHGVKRPPFIVSFALGSTTRWF